MKNILKRNHPKRNGKTCTTQKTKSFEAGEFLYGRILTTDISVKFGRRKQRYEKLKRKGCCCYLNFGLFLE